MEEKKGVRTLEIKDMSTVVEEARTYIYDRQTGKQRSLRVGSPKVNKTFMDGFDWNRIVTIAGLSGSGKSTILRQWLKELVECNTQEDFEVLSFQFEMLGVDEVARDLSSKMSKTVKQIYSADGTLSSEDLTEADKILEELKDYPFYVVDNLGNVQEIKDTILYYLSTKKLIEKNTGLIVTLDHTLLVKAAGNDGEKETIDKLYHTLVLLKKYISSIGGRVIFFILSQLNRNIETTERITNPALHYPNKNDLFGASSVYYSSDYVIIIHRPALIEGLGSWYGPSRKGWSSGLPVYSPDDATTSMVYLHVIKERFGNTKIIAMTDDLKNSKFVEYKV